MVIIVVTVSRTIDAVTVTATGTATRAKVGAAGRAQWRRTLTGMRRRCGLCAVGISTYYGHERRSGRVQVPRNRGIAPHGGMVSAVGGLAAKETIITGIVTAWKRPTETRSRPTWEGTMAETRATWRRALTIGCLGPGRIQTVWIPFARREQLWIEVGKPPSRRGHRPRGRRWRSRSWHRPLYIRVSWRGPKRRGNSVRRRIAWRSSAHGNSGQCNTKRSRA